MQIIHDFDVSPWQYYLNGQDNDFPAQSTCPHCHDEMIGHGFYQRYIITEKNSSYRLHIKRFKCLHCRRTVSLLPSFLLPCFQRSLKAIFTALYDYLVNNRYTMEKRQLHTYLRRFLDNLPGIMAFFRDKICSQLKFIGSQKKKAIKLIERIKGLPSHTFSQRYFDHFQKSFMAL